MAEVRKIGLRMAAANHWDLDLAEEAIQEAFLRMQECWEKDAFPTGRFITIFRNALRDAQRGQRRRACNRLEGCEVAAPPEAVPANEELGQALAKATARLEPKYRLVLEARVRDELGYKQIAKCLGLTVTTVTNRLHEAKKRLLSLLFDETEGEMAKAFAETLRRCGDAGLAEDVRAYLSARRNLDSATAARELSSTMGLVCTRAREVALGLGTATSVDRHTLRLFKKSLNEAISVWEGNPLAVRAESEMYAVVIRKTIAQIEAMLLEPPSPEPWR